MIASHEPWPTSKFRPSNPAARECILLSTGAMNPIHRGHVAMIHAAADRLRAAGYDVLRAYVSPSHDGYVQPKARRLSTLGLSAAFRLEVAQRAVADDPLVAVGAWEAQQPGHWPDFPQVCSGRIACYYCNPTPTPTPNPNPNQVSVRENIAYGMPACAQPEVEAAARLANCHAFIAKLHPNP